jgi:hypothetical protein
VTQRLRPLSRELDDEEPAGDAERFESDRFSREPAVEAKPVQST